MPKEKPRIKIVGREADFVNVIGQAKVALVAAGHEREATELVQRVNQAHGQLGKLEILCEYVQAC